MRETRIFFATDIHGSERCFLKFLSAAKVYNADVIILGGDVTGKVVVPIIEQSYGTFEADFFGSKRAAKNNKELRNLEKEIRDVGSYPYLTNMKEFQETRASEVKVNELFSRLMIETVERWVRLAEERLGNSGVKCFITPGNDDQLIIDSVLRKSNYVFDPEGTVACLDETHEMISTGYSNITPWKCPRDISEEELATKIESMIYQVKVVDSCIFNFHCPPFDSGLDTAPQIDDSLRPVMKGGTQMTISAGSTAVRDAIEKSQPLLGLHGHIHESRGVTKVGRTYCFNPGSEYTEGVLRGVLVDLDRKGLKRHIFTSG